MDSWFMHLVPLHCPLRTSLCGPQRNATEQQEQRAAQEAQSQTPKGSSVSRKRAAYHTVLCLLWLQLPRSWQVWVARPAAAEGLWAPLWSERAETCCRHINLFVSILLPLMERACHLLPSIQSPPHVWPVQETQRFRILQGVSACIVEGPVCLALPAAAAECHHKMCH